MDDQPKTRLLRFADLKSRGIVSSWPQLARLQHNYNFPPGFLISPQVRVWDESEIEAWLTGRRAAGAAAKTRAA
jgi:predicted DNA-binding transcriptional regulator AlpA